MNQTLVEMANEMAIDNLKELASRQAKILKQIEWNGARDYNGSFVLVACPVCGGLKPNAPGFSGPYGHKPGCELEASILSALVM